MNKVVVVLRDWLSDLDRDVLPAVREGGEALREKYLEALAEESASADGSVAALLKAQMEAINARLPACPKTERCCAERGAL
ncbi:MAG: hypothetical protein H7Z19_06095 [Chitinophagaceae bacterium]|nr:hypothetical protein [Rubrivivax sp.]